MSELEASNTDLRHLDFATELKIQAMETHEIELKKKFESYVSPVSAEAADWSDIFKKSGSSDTIVIIVKPGCDLRRLDRDAPPEPKVKKGLALFNKLSRYGKGIQRIIQDDCHNGYETGVKCLKCGISTCIQCESIVGAYTLLILGYEGKWSSSKLWEGCVKYVMDHDDTGNYWYYKWLISWLMSMREVYLGALKGWKGKTLLDDEVGEPSFRTFCDHCKSRKCKELVECLGSYDGYCCSSHDCDPDDPFGKDDCEGEY